MPVSQSLSVCQPLMQRPPLQHTVNYRYTERFFVDDHVVYRVAATSGGGNSLPGRPVTPSDVICDMCDAEVFGYRIMSNVQYSNTSVYIEYTVTDDDSISPLFKVSILGHDVEVVDCFV